MFDSTLVLPLAFTFLVSSTCVQLARPANLKVMYRICVAINEKVTDTRPMGNHLSLCIANRCMLTFVSNNLPVLDPTLILAA